MELKLGRMTMRELSIWFGLRPDSLSKHPKSKEKRLKKLKNFCDYHFEGKNLIVDKIYIPEYSSAYECVETNFSFEWGKIIDKETGELNWQYDEKIDTITRTGKAIWYKYPAAKQVKKETIIAYTGAKKRKDYGCNYKYSQGDKGYCKTVYLNKEKNGLLPKEQYEKMIKCRKEAYAEIGDQIGQIDEAVWAGELTEEEGKEIKGGLDTSAAYFLYQDKVLTTLGFIPERATKLIDF